MQNRVAIVGYSFRLPGADPDNLWQRLSTGSDLVTQVPEDRWSRDVYLHPRKSEPGTSYTFAAGTLGDIAGFDAGFFGISPREAEQMDPQQRLLLELTWEAFERGGILPSSVRGGRGAVFIGVSSTDYAYRRADDLASVDASTMTGNTASIAANRISYQFDLRGPSMAVDTACSSSLVAFHQACQSIRCGEAPLAVVGGVSLHLHPMGFIGFSKASMLSPRGLCNVFDAAGDGYVRAEGAGVFLLKDADAALADGDRIHALVAASGINCDGKTNGMTVPGCETQAALLRDLYRDAEIDPADVDYLEAHGTGTAVGDPVETRALGLALGKARPDDAPLLIGSVKSNVGHLEAASGIAGMVKVLGCLEHRAVPPTIHLETVNPNIRLEEWNLKVVTNEVPLRSDRPLVVGVNSFGFGGANAHVILRGAELPEPPGPVPTDLQAPLLLSARSPAALRMMAGDYAEWLHDHPDVPLYDLAYSAAFHRDALTFRAAAFGADRDALKAELAAFAAGLDTTSVRHGDALEKASRPVFVYSGNGSQWAGMGRTLLGEDAIFREAVEQVDALFQRFGTFSLVDELAADDSPEHAALTEIAQPTLFAVQVGITALLRAWGVAPAAVVGHSVGEVAAAWACGALTLEQAVRVIAARSSEQGKTRGLGGMTAVGMGKEAVEELLEDSGLVGRLVVAGINSARGVTLAGCLEDLQAFERYLAEREVFQRRLKLDYAFHSPAMDDILEPLGRALCDLEPRSSSIPFYSTVTGDLLVGEELGPTYWQRNVREPVQFESAVNSLVNEGYNCFVEVSPSAILRNYVNDCLRQQSVEGRVIPTMGQGDDNLSALRQSLFQLLIAGAPVDLDRLFPLPRPFVRLPTYPWQRERYWYPTTSEAYDLLNRRKSHPLLGYRLVEHEAEWENQLGVDANPVLRDHVVGEAVVFPAAGFVEMALAAAKAWQGDAQQLIEDLEIRAPLLLDDAHSKTVRLRIDVSDGSFVIRSRDRLSGDPWLVNVVGRLLGKPAEAGDHQRLRRPQRAADTTAAEHYALTERVGLVYGPAFRTVSAVWREPHGVLAGLSTPESISGEIGVTHLHAGYLDGAFQLLVDVLREDVSEGEDFAFVPVRVGRLTSLRPGVEVVHARVSLLRRGPRSLVAAFTLYDAGDQVVAYLEDVRFRAVQLRKRRVEHADFLTFNAIPMPRRGDQPIAPLPPRDELLRVVGERLHHPERLSARTAYFGEVEPLLDVLCASFAEHALRSLVANDSPVEPERLIERGVVAAGQAGLLTRLVGMLEEDGVLEPTEAGWRWSPDSSLPAPTDVWISMLGDYPDYAAELLMLGRVGMHLTEMLAGTTSVDEIVPREGASAALAHYAAGSPSVVEIQLAVADVVAATVAQLPPEKRLRILDWCSSRSQLSPRILPVIDFARCDYLLAVSDQRLLDDREALLEQYPQVDTKVARLDEESSGDSVFGGSFDLVFLPAEELDAEDADRMLEAIARQLVPGGLIVLLGQYPARWAELVFGSRCDRSGQFGDGQKVMRPTEWEAIAVRQGLQPIALLHDLPAVTSGGYLLLLQADANQADALQQAPVPANGAWILLQDEDGYSAALANGIASELDMLGHKVVTAIPGSKFAMSDSGRFKLDLCADDQFGALLDKVRDLYGEINGLVHLYGLNAGGGKRSPEALLDAQRRRCAATLSMLRACSDQQITSKCWLVTVRAALGMLPTAARSPLGTKPGDADDAPLWGLGRTAMNEYPDIPIRLVDCVDPDRLERMSAGLLDELLHPDAEDEIIIDSKGRYVPRLNAAPLPPGRGMSNTMADRGVTKLDFNQPGPLKHLQWQEAELPLPGAGEVEIEVRAAGLNFRDVMYAMGLLSDEAVESGFAGATLGMELSGVVRQVGPRVTEFQPGDEVIAFAPASFATRTVTQSGAVVHKPKGWTFEAAATVPTTFFTVYYALHHLANLSEGERVLIHGAAGGVGIAAIQLAKLKGAEIFATAGSPEKRDFVRMLGVEHVMDSRTLDFADQILQLTGGEGVDVVLNSLAGEAINRNMQVLRPFGRFLELGKRDFYENTKVGLRPFRNNISYFGIDADQLMSERPELTRRLFRELMGLFRQELLKPLPFRAFPASEVVDAFRYMQQAKQTGKIVLSFRHDSPRCTKVKGENGSLSLPAEATYLVTGGLSGFGLKTAQWLADKGARHLVLLGRRGLASPEAQVAVSALQAQGVTVHVHPCDVTRRKALAKVFHEIATTLPPLRGIVHAAMVVDDGLLRNLDEKRLVDVLAPKVLGARYLHDLARDLKLDFFVLYSSATTIFGNPGQGNYVAANKYLEALAESRRAQGLPAHCLSWGAIDDVGYLARNEDVKEALQSRMGGPALQSEEALQVLEQVLLRDQSGLGVMDLEWSTMRRFLPTAGAPKYADIARRSSDLAGEADGQAEVRRLLEELGPEACQEAFIELLKREVAEILRISPERLDEHRSMYDQGMDSLMGMELVAAIEERFGVNLPVMALSEGPTIARLVERITRQLQAPETVEAGEGAALTDQVRRMAARHDSELDDAHLDEVAAALEKRPHATQRLLKRT